jgi:hypothetical protein
LENEFGLEESKMIDGIVEICKEPVIFRKIMLAPDVVAETRVATGKGKLDGGNSGEIMARRGVSSRLSDDQFVNLVSKPGWALITSLTF